MKLLKGKTAIITGASRGIGSGIATVFAQQGADVAFTYSSSSEAAESLQKSLQVHGTKVKAYQSNAADFVAAQELAAKVP
jgi:3-oxoacyl-[acyl-carrier protein] reductase